MAERKYRRIRTALMGHVAAVTFLAGGFAACGGSSATTTVTPEMLDSIILVVANDTGRRLRLYGQFGDASPFQLGVVAMKGFKVFAVSGRRGTFRMGMRRVRSSSREPRWAGAVEVTPGDSLECFISIAGEHTAKVELRLAGRRLHLVRP